MGELKLPTMEQVHGRAYIEMDRYECVPRHIATRPLRGAKKSKSRGTYIRSTSQTKESLGSHYGIPVNDVPDREADPQIS